MSAEPEPNLPLEIAHLLLIDVVGYSKVLVDEQIELVRELNQIVRSTESFRRAEASGKLVRLPTGDGMALLFSRSPEEPAQCALEISQALKSHPRIKLRMGVHSGPVNRITDVNDQSNVAGAGINVAQRVMDCGDAGHILLSKHLADDLAQYRHWQPYLHDLGECEVKHGLRLNIVNLCKDGLGNDQVPEKLKRRARWKQARGAATRPISAARWPKSMRLVAVLVSAVALAVSFSTFFHRTSPMATRNLSEIATRVLEKSIAVLPFENLSDEKQNAYFADGVQDEILTNLSRVADLKVISRTSTMQYKAGAQRNLRDIAKALGVSHVVEGSVQRSGGRVHVSAQLIDAKTDMHVWGESYDRDIADVFAIENELAEQIVTQLKSKLSPQEKAAIEQKPTADLVAYDLYVQAKNLRAASVFSSREKETLALAVDLLQQAIARDPAFFLAYYELAVTHDRTYSVGVDHTPARLALAENAVATARRLRPNSGEVHLAAAYHLYCAHRDYDAARAELALARQLLPNESFVFELAGYIDRRQGRWEESIKDFRFALELDPRNFSILQEIAITYAYMRNYAERLTAIDRALEIVPGDVATRVQRALVELDWHANTKPLHELVASIREGDPAAIRELADQWLNLALCERDFSSAELALEAMGSGQCIYEDIEFPDDWCRGVVAQARGDNAGAHAAFQRARAAAEKNVKEQPDYAPAFSVLGLLDAGLGKKAEAIREGARAVELLPISKDSINGAALVEYLATIYAWTGETDQALEKLSLLARTPASLSYGQLCLHPQWDPLRKDPRFAGVIALLAPKREGQTHNDPMADALVQRQALTEQDFTNFFDPFGWHVLAQGRLR